MVPLRSFRHSGPSFSDLIPYAGIVANGVILLKDGSLIVTWRPPERTKAGLTRYVYSDRNSRNAGFADTALQTFETAIRELEQYLSNVLSIARMRQSTSTEDRKKDTREKIELGGLIVKAGLRYEKRALLLGALIDLSQRLKRDEAERARLLALGTEAFGRDSV